MTRVSLCLIVKNEAANLGRCIGSIAGFADEVIVADTGSTDDTVAIAESLGARVIHFPWVNDFSKARNAAIDAATGDWILILDADEELAPDWSARKDGLFSALADAFLVPVENLLPATEVTRAVVAPSVRLFRNVPAHRYEQPIHEQIRPSVERAGGRVIAVDLRVIHHGYLSALAQGASRAARNVELLLVAVVREPRDPWLHVQLGLSARAGGDATLARRHLEEGLLWDRGALDADARARAHTALAQIHLGAKDYRRAANAAKRATEHAPGSLVALHVLAIATALGGDPRRALPLFERVRRSPMCHPARYAELDHVIAWARRAA